MWIVFQINITRILTLKKIICLLWMVQYWTVRSFLKHFSSRSRLNINWHCYAINWLPSTLDLKNEFPYMQKKHCVLHKKVTIYKINLSKENIFTFSICVLMQNDLLISGVYTLGRCKSIFIFSFYIYKYFMRMIFIRYVVFDIAAFIVCKEKKNL